ncbi:MAG: hypothetical protein IT235_02535 [Bacteroidia bacterium]|nr:hypothetical protein [Bacteroidia bacterium]
MDKKDISKNGTSILIFFLLMLYGCYSPKHEQVIDAKEIYLTKNYKNYKNIHELLRDSIFSYVDSSLEDFLGEYLWDWQVDSFICINNENNRLVTTINICSGSCKECVSDEIIKLLGKQLNGKWYFFSGGGTLIVPREYYGKDSMHPLSFHELSQIARKEMFRGALIKNNKGELVVSDEWVDAHFYNAGFYAYPHPKSPGMVSAGEEFRMPEHKNFVDSVHWFKILDKWKHKIDTNEYKPLRRKKENTPAL